jgi:hypothetical protein
MTQTASCVFPVAATLYLLFSGYVMCNSVERIQVTKTQDAYLALVVFLCVPVHARTGVEACSVLLHDDAGDDVLVRLIERLQLPQTVVDDVVRPVCHLLPSTYIMSQQAQCATRLIYNHV